MSPSLSSFHLIFVDFQTCPPGVLRLWNANTVSLSVMELCLAGRLLFRENAGALLVNSIVVRFLPVVKRMGLSFAETFQLVAA